MNFSFLPLYVKIVRRRNWMAFMIQLNFQVGTVVGNFRFYLFKAELFKWKYNLMTSGEKLAFCLTWTPLGLEMRFLYFFLNLISMEVIFYPSEIILLCSYCNNQITQIGKLVLPSKYLHVCILIIFFINHFKFLFFGKVKINGKSNVFIDIGG